MEEEFCLGKGLVVGKINNGSIICCYKYSCLVPTLCLDQTSTESLVSANVLKNFENPNEPILNKDPNSHKVSDWYSIFPVENTELIYGKWEDKIIWDSEAVDKLPSPEVFKLDPNDENLVLALPEDSVQEAAMEDAAPKKEYRSKSRYISKKMLLQEQAEQEVNFHTDLCALGSHSRHLPHFCRHSKMYFKKYRQF